MSEIDTLKKEIAKIKKRNERVEKEKAWETSLTRKASIVILTYFVVSLVFVIIKVERPLVNAVIPTLGYFLSTLSIPLIKKWWLKRV